MLILIYGRNKNGFFKPIEIKQRNDAFTYLIKNVSIIKLLIGSKGK